MIPFDFSYHKPADPMEAVELYIDLNSAGKNPIYYSGGTEIISFARRGEISFGSVIDLKGIKDATDIKETNGYTLLGASLPLNKIITDNISPFLTTAAEGIADYSIRNRLTLGGNICGRLPYREMVLPLLLLESRAVFCGPSGISETPITSVFNKRLVLETGCFLLGVKIPQDNLNLKHAMARRERFGKIDYPLISTAMVLKDGNIFGAVTGVSGFPFLLDFPTSKASLLFRSIKKAAEETVKNIPHPFREDHLAGPSYREHLLKLTIEELLTCLKEQNK